MTHALTDPPADPFELESIEVTKQFVESATPVRTSFGTMASRPAIYLRVRDTSGAVGYGEIWCNFPACGAPHRARLMQTEIVPRVEGRSFQSPRALFDAITRETRRIAIQTGEYGPYAQCIAGLDVAVWDMLARRAGQPLYSVLGGQSPHVPVYASGINPGGAAKTAARLLGEGHTRLKLKVGFDAASDLANMKSLRDLVGDGGQMMVDANQAWDLASARAAINQMSDLEPFWVEEPMAADTPATDWQALREATGQQLAGGENYCSWGEFDAAISGNWLGVIQPDICKWGGISACRDVLLQAKQAGKLTCPHSLGGGVALAGSLHLWAAVQGTGFVEVDGNPNPLREDVFPAHVTSGTITLTDEPGLGVDTDRLDAFFDA